MISLPRIVLNIYVRRYREEKKTIKKLVALQSGESTFAIFYTSNVQSPNHLDFAETRSWRTSQRHRTNRTRNDLHANQRVHFGCEISELKITIALHQRRDDKSAINDVLTNRSVYHEVYCARIRFFPSVFFFPRRKS